MAKGRIDLRHEVTDYVERLNAALLPPLPTEAKAEALLEVADPTVTNDAVDHVLRFAVGFVQLTRPEGASEAWFDSLGEIAAGVARLSRLRRTYEDERQKEAVTALFDELLRLEVSLESISARDPRFFSEVGSIDKVMWVLDGYATSPSLAAMGREAYADVLAFPRFERLAGGWYTETSRELYDAIGLLLTLGGMRLAAASERIRPDEESGWVHALLTSLAETASLTVTIDGNFASLARQRVVRLSGAARRRADLRRVLRATDPEAVIAEFEPDADVLSPAMTRARVVERIRDQLAP